MIKREIHFVEFIDKIPTFSIKQFAFLAVNLFNLKKNIVPKINAKVTNLEFYSTSSQSLPVLTTNPYCLFFTFSNFHLLAHACT
jgi:hypothetical protein